MSYIGRQLSAGNYLKLDDLSGLFNGSTTTFNLTAGGQPYYPGSAYSILVSLGGVVQEPVTSYLVDRNQITFASAPLSSDSFFCIALGSALGIGVPGEGTVNGSKLSQPFNYNNGLLYLDTATNRLGIGTTTPQTRTHIVGTGSTTLLVEGNTRITGILTVGSSSITLDGNNNQVNVGTGVTITNSGFLIGSSNLHSGGLTATSINVSGVGTFASLSVSGNVSIAGTVTYDDVTNVDSLGIVTARTGVRIDAGGLVVTAGVSTLGITSATNLTAQNLNVSGIATVNSELDVGVGGTAFTVLPSGNVGVGVTNPSSKLQVQGTIGFGATDDTETSFPGGRTKLTSSASGFILNHNDNSPTIFQNQGTERVRITSSGSVGIGTISPAENLHIHNPNTSLAVIRLSGSAGSQTPFNIRQGIVGTNNGGFSIYDVNNSATRFAIDPSGNVGINTINPQYTLHVVGSFAATTKSFVIPHPTKEGKKLQYGSLEGPELGVYIRGRTTENIIELPEYWTELVDKDSITVNLTPIGNKNVWVEEINNNKVYINSNSTIDCFYIVFAERKDVEKLVVEIPES